MLLNAVNLRTICICDQASRCPLQDQADFEKRRRRGRDGPADAAFAAPLPAPDAPDNTLLEQTFDQLAPETDSANAAADTPPAGSSSAAAGAGSAGAVAGVLAEIVSEVRRTSCAGNSTIAPPAWQTVGPARRSAAAAPAAAPPPRSATATMMTAEARELLLAGDGEAGLRAYKERIYRKMGAQTPEEVLLTVRCTLLICWLCGCAALVTRTANAQSPFMRHALRTDGMSCCLTWHISRLRMLRRQPRKCWRPAATSEHPTVQVAAVVKHYLAGLHWVMEYYYRGVPSWSWFYPYHYAPFLSDMSGLQQVELEFEISEPVLPFHQVQPPASAPLQCISICAPRRCAGVAYSSAVWSAVACDLHGCRFHGAARSR